MIQINKPNFKILDRETSDNKQIIFESINNLKPYLNEMSSVIQLKVVHG